MGRWLGLAVFVLVPLEAEATQRIPKRPTAEVRDTNDPRAYFDLGVRLFQRDAAAAADAFYWSVRLDPTLAEALYAQRLALIASRRPMLRAHFGDPRRRKASREYQALDSLYLRAMRLNPFFYRSLDRRLLTQYVMDETEASARTRGGQVDRLELQHLVETWLAGASADVRAWVAYSDGNFDLALRLYAAVIKSERYKAPVRLDRARVFALRGWPDSALVEYSLALDEMRKKDEKDLVIYYESKAMVEHSIGLLHEQRNDRRAAREAYGRALQEDLSYHPAHMRLGLLALATGDTATALAELELATQLAEQEPLVKLTLGSTLIASRRTAEGIARLREAAQLEPFWAQPYFLIAEAYARSDSAAAAVAAYDEFLKRASLGHINRRSAEERRATLAR